MPVLQVITIMAELCAISAINCWNTLTFRFISFIYTGYKIIMAMIVVLTVMSAKAMLTIMVAT